MDITLFFALLGGLLVLAFVANRLVRYTRVPDVIILMATGVLIGPVLHWANPDIFRGVTRGFGALALILILFEGGLDLKLHEIVSHFAPAFFLSLCIEVVEARGTSFAFLPSLAFAVILLTNLILLIGTIRARNLRPVPDPAP
jgi:cell volume regulation protein A